MKPIATRKLIHAMAWALFGLSQGPSIALAQSGATADNDAVALDTIVATGTRRQDRTVADTPVPIDILSSEQLLATGQTELNQILSSLLPSFNFPLPSVTDGTDHVRPATLRGLSPDHTLVLVNGKRRHTNALLNVNGSVGRGSSAVDLNSIPVAAIQRIEILRDGAAAQYGSDAIAGVINVVLKDAREGGSISASFGQHRTNLDGVPALRSTSIVDNQLNFNTRGERNAHDGETVNVMGNIGLPIGESGFFNVTAEYRERDATNRSGFDPRENYARDAEGNLDPRELDFDRINHQFGNADVEDINVFYNAGIPINDNWEFYSFGSFGRREGESAGFYRRASDSRNVPEIYPDGFLPFITSDVDDQSIAAGTRGFAGDWNLDLSFVYGNDEFDFGVINSLNTSLGPASPTRFDAGGLEFRHYVVNADAQRLVDVGFLDLPVSVAFGAEYRDEQYLVKAGDPASYIQGDFPGAAGSQVFPGFQPSNEVDGDRDSVAFYAELDADITEAWNVSIAGRFEDYSDFGSTTNGKIATRFQASDSLALRGAVSSGFRAPSLQQQFFTSTATNFVDGVPNEVGTFPVGSDVAQALGATPLDAEESFNASIGLVYQPVPEFNLTLDFYRIKINDRVVLTENLPSSVVVPILQDAGITGVERARFFINGIDTRTHGFDVIGTYLFHLGEYGSLTFTAGFNYNDTEITAENDLPGPLAAVDPNLDLFGRQESLRFERGQPKTKLNTSLNWRWNDLTSTLRVTRYGEVLDPGTSAVTDELLSSKILTDLDVSYQFTDYLGITLGVNNLFDVYPDESPVGQRPDGGNFSVFNQILPYSGFSPFGFNGRYVYSRATVRW